MRSSSPENKKTLEALELENNNDIIAELTRELEEEKEEIETPSRKSKCDIVKEHAKAIVFGSAISHLASSSFASIPNINEFAKWVSKHIPKPFPGIFGNTLGSINIDTMRPKFKFSLNLLVSTALAAAFINFLQSYIPTAPEVGEEDIAKMISKNQVGTDLALAFVQWLQNMTQPIEPYLHPATWFDPAQTEYVFTGAFQNPTRNLLRQQAVNVMTYLIKQPIAVVTSPIILPIESRVTSCVSSLFHRAKNMICRRNTEPTQESQYNVLPNKV